MTLSTKANFPSARCYVLKLHRDAAPSRGHLMGRLEHIASGEHIDFASGRQLLAWMARHADAADKRPSGEEAT